MESYIEDMKKLYTLIHTFLEEPVDLNDVYDDTKREYFPKLNSEGDLDEIRQFLEIINSIGENHHRDQNFNKRINEILKYYKDQIKGSMPSIEIFRIFEHNKKVVHFLLKENIITISEEIYQEMINKIENNGKRYCHFFIPELENFVGEEKISFFKNELLTEDPNIFMNYERKREEGENDSYICSLIRQDSVEDFISHVNRYIISPSSKISPSIFETNPFLIDNKNTTLIEYSAFFGSIQIFQYFLMNGAELKPSLWLYAIHSKNPEIIHLLERNKVPPPKNYDQCLIESIKCHHNDVAEYIENNLIDQNEKYLLKNDEIISNCIKYHNYSYFQIDAIVEHGFFYLCFYHYDKLFTLLKKKKEKLIENKIKQYPNIEAAVDKNDIEVIYHYLLKIQENTEIPFNSTQIKQIVIPTSVTSIGEEFFGYCKSLTRIAFEIPSSVALIRRNAFRECSSLTQITIPSFVTSIGNSAFEGCSSLTQITFEIPSSVTSIGNYAFSECSSLMHIAIPSFVTSIGDSAFYGCSSLIQITIPSSVTSIGFSAFSECSSLTHVTFEIPSSLISIGNYAFCECSKLKQITIPSSVTSIKFSAFSGCSSLAQITFEIPSSVTSIGNYAFCGCSSLTQITIPSSVTSIGDDAFSFCSSLSQVTLLSSVTEIGSNTFSNCKMLTQISNPNSLVKIEE